MDYNAGMFPRFTFIPVALLFLALPSQGQNQEQMTQQAEADYEKADADLKAVYSQVLAAMKDTTGRHKLEVAENAWAKYRDAQAELDADAARGGSLQPQIYALSEDATTRTRTAQLKELLKELQAQ